MVKKNPAKTNKKPVLYKSTGSNFTIKKALEETRQQSSLKCTEFTII